MVTRITLFAAVLIAIGMAGAARGEDKSPAGTIAADKAPAEKTADPRIDALQRKIDDLEAKLDSKLMKLDVIAKQLDDLRKDAGAPLKSIVKKEPTEQPDQPALPGNVEGGDPATPPIRTTDERLADFTQKLDDISTKIEALRSDDLPELKKSLGQVRVKAARPVTDGWIVIENLRGLPHDVTINGQTYHIEAVSNPAQIPIKYGPVTTQLYANESPQNWGTSYWTSTDRGPVMRLRLR